MSLRAWFADTWSAYRRIGVLDHCARIVARLLWTALRAPVWLAIALMLLPHLAAVLVTAAIDLLQQWLLRIDDGLAALYGRLR